MISPVIRLGSLYSPATFQVQLVAVDSGERERVARADRSWDLANCSSISAWLGPRLVQQLSEPPFSQSNLYTCEKVAGSTPLTVSVPPLLILASVNWMPVAVFTPGTCRRRSPPAPGSDRKFWPWMIRSLVIERSIAPRNESLKPFTNTATNTIRADADHQRGRGHRGAAGVARGVLPGQTAGRRRRRDPTAIPAAADPEPSTSARRRWRARHSADHAAGARVRRSG